MNVHQKSFYIDYLDHLTSESNNLHYMQLRNRLRFDLLVFGQDILCMSVPACIKLKSTTELLIKLDDFWANGRIQLQLDKKHKEDPFRYFDNRKKILSRSMPEEQLLTHFEFVAYEDSRTSNFYKYYLPQFYDEDSKSKIFIPKPNDTDLLFRQYAADQFETHYDNICRFLDLNSQITFTAIASEIEDRASDSQSLFQRALIEDVVRNNFQSTAQERQIVATFLDRAFALANAKASNAYPLTLILNQLTGKSMIELLSKVYPKLYHEICELSWTGIYRLSQTNAWIGFVKCINAFIYIVQHLHKNHEPFSIDELVKKFESYSTLYTLTKFIKDKAIDNVKSKMYEQYIFSQSQDPDQIFDLLLDCYSGKYKRLVDVMIAIDRYEEGIEKELSLRKYNYLQDLGTLQQKSNYEIFK